MTLGQVLKEARQRKGMSLREVERVVPISNGYLSLLESDQIKSPSPNHLHQLGEAYGVAYSLLMELAGYAAPKSNAQIDFSAFVGPISDLTGDELAQVRSFVGYLKSSRTTKSDS